MKNSTMLIIVSVLLIVSNILLIRSGKARKAIKRDIRSEKQIVIDNSSYKCKMTNTLKEK